MTKTPKRVHFRVAEDTLKSSIIKPVSALFHAAIGMADLELRQDIRDGNVFSVELPSERETGVARQLVNALNKERYISEAWDEPVRVRSQTARQKQSAGLTA